mgnify:FL=1
MLMLVYKFLNSFSWNSSIHAISFYIPSSISSASCRSVANCLSYHSFWFRVASPYSLRTSSALPNVVPWTLIPFVSFLCTLFSSRSCPFRSYVLFLEFAWMLASLSDDCRSSSLSRVISIFATFFTFSSIAHCTSRSSCN